MIDCIDDVGDSFDIFDDLNQHSTTAIWNGREVTILDPEQLPQFVSFASKIFQFPDEPQPFPHVVTLLDLLDEEPSDILKNVAERFTWEKIVPPTPDLLYPSILTGTPLPYPSILTGISEAHTISKYFKTDGYTKDGMQITFINGMLNTFKDSFGNAEYVQKWSPGNLSIDGIYNHSNGYLDYLEVFKLNYKGYSPVTQDLLMQKWTEFHESNQERPDAKILHFCHSQGAIHTKNALLRLPEEIRKRVIVVAIAPAAVVSRDWCYDAFNYASKNDLVPSGELLSLYWQAGRSGETFVEEMLMNISKLQSELIWLEPHEGATGIDHWFQSLTFAKLIQEHIEDYERRHGEYR